MGLDYQIERLGDVALQSGETLRDAQIAFKTYGTLNSAADNAILLFTSFGANHLDFEWMIGEGRALDPGRHFIVIFNLFGNGLSSSPSTMPRAEGRSTYRNATHYDNARLQYAIVTNTLRIRQVRLALGWSMGGQLALHWAALFPEIVERVAALCASARTAAHNHVFLEGVKAALLTDQTWNGGRFDGRPERGLRAVGRIYAGWALSQEFYRHEAWRGLGFSSLEAFIADYWEAPFLMKDADNLLAHIWTWQHADISDNPRFQGDFGAALGSVRAEALLMPCHSDLYFRVEDNAIEAARMPNARLAPLSSIWGHRAGNPKNSPADAATIDQRLKAFMAGA